MKVEDLLEKSNQEQEQGETQDYCILNSKLLNEKIVLCMSKELLGQIYSQFSGLTIYFPPEIVEIERAIQSMSDERKSDFVRAIHLVKKKFGAWVVPRENLANRE